ncbi:MAG: type II toxin-antitoxin system HicA family toxin [Rhodospirillales bacterium]|nr:type II toxin-antitoxin system HicA family toxin [Rhodospirillales bacterium]
MNSAEIVKRLKREGWVIHRVRGSHHQFSHPERAGLVTVPHPRRDLPIGTARNIYRQAGWNWSERE